MERPAFDQRLHYRFEGRTAALRLCRRERWKTICAETNGYKSMMSWIEPALIRRRANHFRWLAVVCAGRISWWAVSTTSSSRPRLAVAILEQWVAERYWFCRLIRLEVRDPGAACIPVGGAGLDHINQDLRERAVVSAWWRLSWRRRDRNHHPLCRAPIRFHTAGGTVTQGYAIFERWRARS